MHRCGDYIHVSLLNLREYKCIVVDISTEMDPLVCTFQLVCPGIKNFGMFINSSQHLFTCLLQVTLNRPLLHQRCVDK